jgi:tetratricopeptide (TPR) repeat protein
MNPILESLLAGLEQDGLDYYQTLVNPTAEDDRWAGLCLVHRQDLLEAQDLLKQAIARGCREASIELAISYWLLNNIEEAKRLLASLCNYSFNPFDQVLYWRESGLQAHRQGNQQEALAYLEQAWSLCLSDHQLKPLQGGVAHVLGMIYNSVEEYQKALYYFSRGLETMPLGRRSRLLTYRGLCRINLGHLEAAAQDFDQAKIGLSASPALAATLEYALGMLARTKGDWAKANTAFLRSAELSSQALDFNTTYYAELGLVATFTASNQPHIAQLHLARAKRFLQPNNSRDGAYFALREGALLARLGDKLALERLSFAESEFHVLGASRERLWALLHRIEAHLRLNEPDQSAHLLELAGQMAFAYDSKSTLIESSGLAQLKIQIEQLPDNHSAHQIAFQTYLSHESKIELLTLGKAELRINGQVIGLDMVRTIEIMVYLLINPHSRRDQILSALFPDTDPKRATDYFHQAKKYLHDNAKIIAIEYFPKQKTYALSHSSKDFFWDVRALQQLLSSHDENRVVVALEQFKGKFLPEATSTWAERERENLAWSIAKVGLQTLQKWSNIGEHQKCLSLAERLLEIELDVGLAEYLVNATLALDGELAAKRALVRLQHRFLAEIDEIPKELLFLEQTIRLVN